MNKQRCIKCKTEDKQKGLFTSVMVRNKHNVNTNICNDCYLKLTKKERDKLNLITKEVFKMNKLPNITINNKVYTFDERLKELRILNQNILDFIALTNNETELLSFAFNKKDFDLVVININEIEYNRIRFNDEFKDFDFCSCIVDKNNLKERKNGTNRTR